MGWKRAAMRLPRRAVVAFDGAVNAWPILFLSFPVMVWLIDGAGAGRWRGVPRQRWPAGGSASAISCRDYTGSATRSGRRPHLRWLLPFAVLGLPAYLALFTAFGFALARLIWTGTPHA